jgi:O-methyltransferase
VARFRRAVRALFNSLGYEIYAIGKGSTDYEASLRVDQAQLYARWLAPCPLFSPWLGEASFQEIYGGAHEFTIVSPDRCYVLISLARYASHLTGDFAECGVYKGGTALMLARVLGADTRKTLYLFDSFQGLPAVNSEKDQWFVEGEFAAGSVQMVEGLVDDFRSKIAIRAGWIPGTFRGLEQNHYAFAHLDVDLYQSTLDCCAYFYPRIVPGGIILFDEYAFAAARGEKDAVDAFFADKPECPITLPTGQAVVIKVPPRESERPEAARIATPGYQPLSTNH